jgi:saccharopine dehydrogenase-like NADP-dependent oxidoreductase
MTKVTVLGGCGAVGSIATETLASSGIFSEVTVADINIMAARKLARTVKGSKLTAVEFDAENSQSVRRAIGGSSVVLNCVGPFYKHGPNIMKTVIETRINYVDVCDDFDATEKLLAMDDKAKKAGVSALI